ncbi:MAG: hypothetical protein IMY70_07320, partial [Bacteroidetes bacterium]|nr:hypothetical protein [Bacteroidota bacterium]
MKQLNLRIVNKWSGLFKIIFTISLVILLANDRVKAQDELDVIRNNWLQFSDVPNSLYHHLTSEAFELLESRTEKIAQIHTRDEWRQRQKMVRQTIWEILGPFPEKTPLNARITGTV